MATRSHHPQTDIQKIQTDESYEKLTAIYDSLSNCNNSVDSTLRSIFEQLTEFTSAELLSKSLAPLWTIGANNTFTE
jgi:hypothetical protein